MAEDKLIQLASDMTDKLRKHQERELISHKRLLNKAKELEEKLETFEETKNMLTDL